MQDYIEVKSNGKITAKKGTNPRSPYNHQKDAMAKLNLIDQEESFSTLVVLPTGGGKTYEYSCGSKSQIRKFGNRSSGTRKSSFLCLITVPFL